MDNTRSRGTHLNILICHSDIIRIGSQVLRCSHDCELNCPLVSKCFVGPFPNGPYLFDSCDTVVCDKNLDRTIVSLGSWPSSWGPRVAYRSDDSMSIIVGNEVLDPAGWGCRQVITTDEVGGEVVLRCVGAGMTIDDRLGDAIRLWQAVCVRASHCKKVYSQSRP